MIIHTQHVPYFTTRDGRTVGYWRARVARFNADSARYDDFGPGFDGVSRAEAIGLCVLGTPDLTGISGTLLIVDDDPVPVLLAAKGGA